MAQSSGLVSHTCNSAQEEALKRKGRADNLERGERGRYEEDRKEAEVAGLQKLLSGEGGWASKNVVKEGPAKSDAHLAAGALQQVAPCVGFESCSKAGGGGTSMASLCVPTRQAASHSGRTRAGVSE